MIILSPLLTTYVLGLNGIIPWASNFSLPLILSVLYLEIKVNVSLMITHTDPVENQKWIFEKEGLGVLRYNIHHMKHHPNILNF